RPRRSPRFPYTTLFRSKDPLYASRHASARDADFLFGAYHFYRANASAADQVANFVDVVKRVLPGDLPPSFDFEEGGSGPDGLKADRKSTRLNSSHRTIS